MGVVRSAVNVLLDGVPAGVDYQSIRRQISEIPGVSNLHDVHIWSIR